MACLLVAASWNWRHVLLSLFLGFYALLRPSDLTGLQRSDLMLPMEHDSPQLGLLIRLRTPKRHVSGARVQYTRVDGQHLCPLVVFLIRRMDRSQLIWPSSAPTLGRRFRKILGQLVPLPATFSLGSLRAGGATFLFGEFDEDLQRLAWRGRWRQINTLAHYVHELAASRIGMAWSSSVRERLREIADSWECIAAEYLTELES